MHWTLKFVRIYARMLLLENRNLGDSGPQVPVPLLDPSSPSLPIERPYCENWDCRRSRGVLNNLSWYLTQAVHQSKLCLWESDTAKYVEIPAQASECSETECTKLKANEDKLIAYLHRVTSPRFDKKPNRFFCMAPLNLVKLNFICGCSIGWLL